MNRAALLLVFTKVLGRTHEVSNKSYAITCLHILNELVLLCHHTITLLGE